MKWQAQVDRDLICRQSSRIPRRGSQYVISQYESVNKPNRKRSKYADEDMRRTKGKSCTWARHVSMALAESVGSYKHLHITNQIYVITSRSLIINCSTGPELKINSFALLKRSLEDKDSLFCHRTTRGIYYTEISQSQISCSTGDSLT